MGYGGIIGQTGVSGEYLPLTGGTLTGNLDMSNHGIQNVSSISSSNSALIVPNNINVNSHRILNLSQPVNNTDAATKAYVDSKASNWVKAATHSQYDEWHLAVEGGTFVKLVANSTLYNSAITIKKGQYSVSLGTMDPPLLSVSISGPPIVTVTANEGIGFISANINSQYELYLSLRSFGVETGKAGLSVFKGNEFLQYFVPSTDDLSDID